jgi:hypothetical protein
VFADHGKGSPHQECGDDQQAKTEKGPRYGSQIVADPKGLRKPHFQRRQRMQKQGKDEGKKADGNLQATVEGQEIPLSLIRILSQDIASKG